MTSDGHVRPADLWLVAGAIGLSAAGDFIALIGLALQGNEMHGDGIGVSLVFICLWAPIAVLAGYVGLVVDRYETTRLLAFVSVFQAVAAVSLAFVSPFALLLALTVVLGAGVAVAQSAEFALVPVVAGNRSIQSANGIVETARYIGFTVGPLAGGALTAAGGVRLAMLVDAASFLVVAAVALGLQVRRHPEPVTGARRRARDGIGFLIEDRVLALVMTAAFVSLLFMSASIPADLVYVQDVLGVEDIGIGIVLTAWTVGIIVGRERSLAADRQSRTRDSRPRGDRRSGPRQGSRPALARVPVHDRLLPDRRRGTRCQERLPAVADPRAGRLRPTRARLRRLQRAPQHRRARRSRRRRPARRHPGRSRHVVHRGGRLRSSPGPPGSSVLRRRRLTAPLFEGP